MIPGFEKVNEQLDALTVRGDLISRKAAIDELKECRKIYCDNTTESFSLLGHSDKSRVDEIDNAIAILVNLPSAQPERKTGKWIKHKDRGCWFCSECNADDYYAYSWDCDTGEYKFQDNYCPNCGADMQKEGAE